MAKIIDGKKISQEVKDECRERIAREGLNLTLAVVQVGNDLRLRFMSETRKKHVSM